MPYVTDIARRLSVAICSFIAVVLFFGCASTRSLSSQEQEVEVGRGPLFKLGLKFKIAESNWRSRLNGKKPQHQYLVVKAELRNPTSHPIVAMHGRNVLDFRVVNTERGFVYDPISIVRDPGNLVNINPGVAVSHVLVFDVPAGQYKLRGTLYDMAAPKTFNILVGRDPREIESFEIPLVPGKTEQLPARRR